MVGAKVARWELFVSPRINMTGNQPLKTLNHPLNSFHSRR